MDDRQFLRLAIDQARKSVANGGFPAGAVLEKNGKIRAAATSECSRNNDPTGHAETVAIRKACNALKTTDLGGATIYASLESCTMCFCAANWAGISKIVYALQKDQEMVKKYFYEGSVKNSDINRANNRKIELVFLPGLEKESLKIIEEWEKKQ